MSLDANLPFELDDGTPMELVGAPAGNNWQFRAAGNKKWCAYRDNNRNSFGKNIYWYDTRTGVFGGGNERTFKVMRNVIDDDPEPEDWS